MALVHYCDSQIHNDECIKMYYGAFVDSTSELLNYGIGSIVVFAIGSITVSSVVRVFDWSRSIEPIFLAALMFIWVVMPYGWQLLVYYFFGEWNYSMDSSMGISALRSEDVWFLINIEFWGAVVGVLGGYVLMRLVRFDI
ncbi:hypothetical protein [Burkholderia ambifaria]|uniref:hypothetical protein n=1 Tax=Burkholderia ambifaria TaxID=152480 RepID=UPI00158B308B|nr:hypothetical protein [Burkholderia ambifaria]